VPRGSCWKLAEFGRQNVGTSRRPETAGRVVCWMFATFQSRIPPRTSTVAAKTSHPRGVDLQSCEP